MNEGDKMNNCVQLFYYIFDSTENSLHLFVFTHFYDDYGSISVTSKTCMLSCQFSSLEVLFECHAYSCVRTSQIVVATRDFGVTNSLPREEHTLGQPLRVRGVSPNSQVKANQFHTSKSLSIIS